MHMDAYVKCIQYICPFLLAINQEKSYNDFQGD